MAKDADEWINIAITMASIATLGFMLITNLLRKSIKQITAFHPETLPINSLGQFFYRLDGASPINCPFHLLLTA
jgi:hypothetical protein